MKVKRYNNLPDHATRSGKVTHVAVHHAAGNASLDSCYNSLKKARSSATYAIDSNGNVGQFLSESLEPYTTSDRDIDDKAITIEVSNDSGAPNWHVSDKALASLIELLVDVCKRHNIVLKYTGDKSGNLVKHSYYANTACPGPYLGGKFKYIQDEVNKKIKESKAMKYKPHYKLLKTYNFANRPNGQTTLYVVELTSVRDKFDVRTGKRVGRITPQETKKKPLLVWYGGKNKNGHKKHYYEDKDKVYFYYSEDLIK